MIEDNFKIPGGFESQKFLLNLKLSSVFLKNSKNPWVILVPRRANISELFELSECDRTLLVEEICFVSKTIQDIYKCDKINVGAIGNMVKTLHIHIIGRYKSDIHWPDVMWNKKIEKLSEDELVEYQKNITKALNKE